MKIYKLKYFLKHKSICYADFDNKENIDLINSEYIVSISELKSFRMPLSGEIKKEKSATVSMINGNLYHIREDSFIDLIKELI